MKVIIYKQDNGSVAVVYPNQTVVDEYGIDALAKKMSLQVKLIKL